MRSFREQPLTSLPRRPRAATGAVIEREPRPMATRPDCTISLIPNGSRSRSSASSLSAVPVASMVSASGATSTTRARNSDTVSSTCDRVGRSARTLTRSSSRCTDAVDSSSTILSTLTSLLSCLVTCSSGESSALTTMVMREISGCSVSPTASESMLKPRRENRPATRARTPGLFSTSTESVCLLISSVPMFWVRGRRRRRSGRTSRANMISSLLVPAATIGHTIASLPTTKSTTTGRR